MSTNEMQSPDFLAQAAMAAYGPLITEWLRNREHVRSADEVAAQAWECAQALARTAPKRVLAALHQRDKGYPYIADQPVRA